VFVFISNVKFSFSFWITPKDPSKGVAGRVLIFIRFFSGIKDFEFGASFENQFAVELLKKMEISRLHARNNLAYAQNLVNKYKTRLAKISKEMSVADAKIDAQVETINKSDENVVDKPKNVVKIETPALPAQPESIVCQTK